MTGNQLNDTEIGGLPRKRKAIDLELKMKIINMFESGQKQTSISRKFNLAHSTVKTILNARERIKRHVNRSGSLKSTVITKQRSGALSEMEKLLLLWIEDQNLKNMPPSFTKIQRKARVLFEDIKEKLGDSEAKFVASNGWLKRFKTRSNLQHGKLGVIIAEETKEPESYPEILTKIIEDGGYTADQIYNVDEDVLFWKKLLNRTHISKEGNAEPGCKADKDRLTLLLGGNADGGHKLKPYFVYHYENPRSLRNISKATLPVYYRSNHNASVTITLFEDWFINCFIPEVEKYCSMNNIPFKILLIVDNASGHPEHLDDFHANVKVVFLPPNLTSVLQPMEQGIMNFFKAFYLKRTFAQAVKEIEMGQTLNNFFKSYNLYQAILNISKAWEEVSETCLNAAWKELCPQFVCSLIDYKKDETYKDVTYSIVKLARQLNLEVEPADVEELLDAHGTDLTNDELMELEEEKVKEDSAETEPVEKPRRFITDEMAIAFREISSAMGRFEKMDPNSSRFLKVQKGIDETLACYAEIYEKKKVQASLDKLTGKAITSQPSTSVDDSALAVSNVNADCYSKTNCADYTNATMFVEALYWQ